MRPKQSCNIIVLHYNDINGLLTKFAHSCSNICNILTIPTTFPLSPNTRCLYATRRGSLAALSTRNM